MTTIATQMIPTTRCQIRAAITMRTMATSRDPAEQGAEQENDAELAWRVGDDCQDPEER